MKRDAQGELPAAGIGADHELDHETARAVRVFDAEIGEACLPGILGHGLVPVAERAVPEIFAHDFLLSAPKSDNSEQKLFTTKNIMKVRTVRITEEN